MRFAHGRHLRNSFPVVDEARHPQVNEEAFKMHSYQETEVAFPISFWRTLRTISAVLNRTSRRLHESREAARQERVVSKLAPHLRHDIGELDCRPPQPLALSETLKAHRHTLESMWLHNFDD
jgi:hypothetical protein